MTKHSQSDKELIQSLYRQMARTKQQMSDMEKSLGEWKQLFALANERLGEAERLLWPNRFTNAKVGAHFAKWMQDDRNESHWGSLPKPWERQLS